MKDSYLLAFDKNTHPDIPLNVFLNLCFPPHKQPLILEMEKNVYFWEYINDYLQEKPYQSKFCDLKTPFTQKIKYEASTCQSYLYQTILKCALDEIEASDYLRETALQGSCSACTDQMWGIRGKTYFPQQ